VLRVTVPTQPLATQDDDALASASAVNREMERLILQCPGQYLWAYHRYKQPRQSQTAAEAAR
jgi:KDO2-lipid IV(A) lauroyltransferase